ncbi:unnamed protein product [Oikopleura dioica]|uniref:Arf-GAP domain-containing protein n=1 Tax=Oikopleura dioica TaxID=34765 RepID=E4XU86_OIKDI|nr:unnamed protein product [Oikopleura dioica]
MAPQSKSQNEKHKMILNQLLQKEENKYCADCKTKSPRWASWNLGIFMCIRCSGIHRGMGVHISKVKSVNLDTWTPEQMQSICSKGNEWGKNFYEANLASSFTRPVNDDSKMERFIREKYEKKKYCASKQPALNSVSLSTASSRSSNQQRQQVSVPLPKQNASRDTATSAIPRARGARSGVTSPIEKIDNGLPQAVSTQAQAAPSSGFDDLLGLGSPAQAAPAQAPAQAPVSTQSPVDDIFGDFTSAEAPNTQSSAPTHQGANLEQSNGASQPGKKSNADILALFGAAPAAAPNPMQGFGQMNQANQFGGNPMPQQGFSQQSPMGLSQQAQPFGNQSAFPQQQPFNTMHANPMHANPLGQMNNFGSFQMGNQFNQGVQPSQAAFNAANPFMTHSNIAQPPQQPAHNSLDQLNIGMGNLSTSRSQPSSNPFASMENKPNQHSTQNNLNIDLFG